MRRNYRTAVLFAALIAFALCESRCRASDTPQAEQIECTGKVVDAQGSPLAGAEVALHIMEYSPGSELYPVTPAGASTTGADGAFTFKVAADSESYRYGYMVARKKGLALGFGTWEMRQGDRELEIELGEPKELAGIVVDENDKPVGDAEVYVSMLIIGTMADQRGVGGPLALDMFAATTDDTGRFRFTAIPADAMAEFQLRKPGRATISTFRNTGSGSQKLKYKPGQPDIKLTLPIEARIEGVAVEAGSGKPVAGVEIVVRGSQQAGYFSQSPVTTDEHGKFSMGALVSETYSLELVQPSEGLADWVARPLEVATETGKTSSNVQLELHKGGLLQVAVTEAVGGKPVKQATASLRRQADNKYFGARTDENGIARFRLTAGDFQFSGVYKDGYSRQSQDEIVTITDGTTTRLERRLTDLPAIAGVVRNEQGDPVQGVRLEICPMGIGENVSSDAEGKFKVNWDPGRWHSSEIPAMVLVARYEQGNLAAAADVDEDTQTQDLVLGPAVTLTGRVADPNDKGIAGAGLTIMLRRDRWGSSMGRSQPIADKEGRFEIKALPAGNRYTLYARADGYGENRNENIEADEAVDNRLDIGDVTLAVADLAVSGVVVNGSDEPVAGAYVSSYGENQQHQSARTGADGKFKLDGICAGTLRISASKTGAAQMSGSVETEGGATDVRIVISERSSSTRFVPKQPPSLVRKPLPDLKGLNVDFPQASTGGKMILVCLLDVEQRPSRNILRQLSTRAQQLAAKGVVVAAVQASKIDPATLEQWRKQYDVSFPVTMIPGETEKTRFTWGVRSLPWLILTDTRHVVTAAGFRLSELDEKIKATR